MEKTKYFEISSIILDSALMVHKEMGPGLLESVYQECMVKELTCRNIKVQTNFAVPLIYKGEPINKLYLADLIIENEIVGELKSVEVILPVHEAQIISYLKLSKKKLGFLINFNVSLLKNGFHRYVNGF